MKNSSKIITLVKLALFVSALGILFISYYYYQPGYDPTSSGLSPRLSQMLAAGGIAIALAIYSWFWPVFGGITAICFGLCQIFGHPLNALAGHNPFERNLFTLASEPLYYTLYGIFTLAGVLCILTGWKHRKFVRQDTTLSVKIQTITFRTSIGLTIILPIYGLMVFILSSYSPDYLLGSLFYLVPSVFMLMWISRQWPAQGGLLEIVTGIFWLILGMIPNWEKPVFIPYAILCSLLIITGLLNITRGYRIRFQTEVEA